MSGVGEVIAIVSCVAGLIEALDAGCRIVKNIKERRQAHRANGALPPSDELEKTIEGGKESIQKFVAKGNHRFGPQFEEGDETAQIAIMRVTIQIQNVLLNRLTQARADDGVVDFAECIDLSDQGCNEALIALQQLYQRKLEIAIPKKQEAALVEIETPVELSVEKRRIQTLTEKPTAVQRVKTAPAAPISAQKRSQDLVQGRTKGPVDWEESDTSRTTKQKSSGGFRHRLFHTKSGSAVTYHSILTTSPEVPKPSRRRTTTSLDKHSSSTDPKRASRASMSSHSSSNPDQPEPGARISRAPTWSQGMSRASTLGPMEPIAATPTTEIAKYEGSCKYAFFIRENGPKGNLEAQNTNMYSENWVLQCKSQKCKFGKQARDVKTREQIDDTVWSSHGIQYRWLFLAKSHCAQNTVSSDWPYVCLICQLLNHDPQKHYGHEHLFSHISKHQEEDICGISLEGPLTFSNRGIKTETAFDLRLPKREARRQSAMVEQERRTAEELQRKLNDVQVDRNSKTSSMESTQTDDGSVMSATTEDLYTNHWADEK